MFSSNVADHFELLILVEVENAITKLNTRMRLRMEWNVKRTTSESSELGGRSHVE